MKKILNMIMASLLLFACAKDPAVTEDEIKHGTKEEIMLNIDYTLAEQSTRAAVNETLVENINLYIFNELGDLTSYGYFTENQPFETVVYSNLKYTIYAIANAGKQLYATNIAELEAIRYDIENISQMVSGSGAVLMSGKADLQKLTDGQKVTVNLARCVSKIVVKANYSELNSDVQIDITSLQLKNAPKYVNVFKNSKITSAADAMNGDIISNISASDMKAGIVMYQYENMQGTLLPGNLDQSKKVWPESSDYYNTCSYVEMKASYSSERKRGNILYRFYLGTDMFSNFDVMRNTQHNITVHFKGDGAVDENTWRVDNSDIVDLVTSITLDPTSHAFTELGATLQINAAVRPVTAANKEISWKSSNNAVAKVDATGKVTAVGDGKCTITATSIDGTDISASCSIEVDSKTYVTGISVSPESLDLFPGEQGQLTASIEPADASVADVTWSTSDEDIAMVDATGKVTAVAVGKCIITATSKDDSSKSASCSVTVKDKEFSITPTSMTLYIGESSTITYTAVPSATATFVSENTDIAVVDDNGKVTAVANGETKIKVSANGIDLYCTVKVSQTDIAFSSTSKIMYDGEEATLQYSKLVPSTATVNVTSSNSSIVQVVESSSDGVKIKALKEGNATITATIEGTSTSASCSIRVEKLRIVPTVSQFVVYNHFNYDIGYTIYPSHAASLGVVLESANLGSNIMQPDAANNPARVRGIKASSSALSLKMSIAGRSDVYANIDYTVKEPSVRNEIKTVVNKGYKDVVENLNIDIAPQASLQHSLSMVSGQSRLFGTLDNSIKVDLNNSKVTFPNPNGANGQFELYVTCKGDDNADISMRCLITVYETIYLVGKSKTMDKENISNADGVRKVKYINEVVAEWLAHPNSLFFENGIVDGFSMSYIYDGVEYDTDHPEVTEELTFSFVKGNSYPLALDAGYITYNGNNALAIIWSGLA